MLRIGLISDTHGLLRPEALAALRASDHILHAGDIGSQAVLDGLREIAPVSAVRGNNDEGPWARAIAESLALRFEDATVYLIHDLARLDIDPRAAGVGVVVSGHSHRPLVREEARVLFVNPGSAGPRRFTLPVSVGRLLIRGGRVEASLETLAVPAARR